MLSGKPAIRGTRMAVSLILGCLSEKMTIEEIEKTYGSFPKESLPEIFRFAAEAVDRSNVAA